MSEQVYTPRPGSTCERAYHLLLARGCELAAPDLADAIDLEPASGLHASLSTAVNYGFMLKRVANGTAYYRLPGVEPAAPAEVPPKKEQEPTRGDQARSERAREGMEPKVCESADGRGTAGAPALATLPTHESPGVGPMGAGQPADAGPTGGMRVALWSDNELVIERAGQPRIVFDKDETRKLLDYLFRMEGSS